MKRFVPVIVFIILAVAAWHYSVTRIAKNPDPNHTHADFAVWVGGTKLDFSDARYMSEVPTGTGGIARAPGTSALRQFLHLHDGNGHVIHRHKPGLTLGDFFASIGMPMTIESSKLCFALPDPFGKTCSRGSMQWLFFVNGKEMQASPKDYVFADGDRIALIFNKDDGTFETYDDFVKTAEMVTDDACRYSLTCPGRGTPPKEDCIADPTVPCMAP